MSPEEANRALGRILAAWPTPKMTGPTADLWREHLGQLEHEAAVKVLTRLEKQVRHRPSLAEVHEAYDQERPARREAVGQQSAPECGICDDGWIIVRCAECVCGEAFNDPGFRCMRAQVCVARCPNGCLPLRAEEREARNRRDDEQARRERKRAAERALDLRLDSGDRMVALRDPSGPRRDEDVF